MRAWTELLLLLSNFTGGIIENEKQSDTCFCERRTHKKKKRNKTRSGGRENRDTPPVMFLSTLLQIIATLILQVRRRFGLIRKRVRVNYSNLSSGHHTNIN